MEYNQVDLDGTCRYSEFMLVLMLYHFSFSQDMFGIVRVVVCYFCSMFTVHTYYYEMRGRPTTHAKNVQRARNTESPKCIVLDYTLHLQMKWKCCE